MLEPFFDFCAIVFATPKRRAKIKRAIKRREESRARSRARIAEYRRNAPRLARERAFRVANGY